MIWVMGASPFPMKTFYLSLRRFPWTHLSMPPIFTLKVAWPRFIFGTALGGESVTLGGEACLRVANGFSSGWAEAGPSLPLGVSKEAAEVCPTAYTTPQSISSVKAGTCKAAGESGEKATWKCGVSPLILNSHQRTESADDTQPSPSYLQENFLPWASLGKC